LLIVDCLLFIDMVFSYNWLQSFFKKKLPKPEKLAEFLTMHSFEVPEVKKTGSDWVLDIDVLPNRGPDCFSHLGIAREIAVITDSQFQIPDSGIEEDKVLKAKDFVSVNIKDSQVCPRYTARVITDLKVGPSPKWIRDRLLVCGLRPINNVVDIANYVMLETGQPLHAFDFEKLSSTNHEFKKITNKKIIVRKAKRGERITTLDEEKYDLDEDILVIADSKSPLAIAGIKGGKKAEIDSKTKMIVIESANFNSRIIRRSSKKIDLKTDASWRFEHGIDPNLTEFAINRAALLIQKIACPVGSRRDSYGAGGKICQGLVDFYPKKISPKIIKLDLDYLKRLLGVEIPKTKVKKILEKLGLKIKNLKLKIITIEVPTFRLDISIPEDLIEEIGRIYGYEKIPSVFPIVALIPAKRNLDIFWEDFSKNTLKEAGFGEVYNYSFIGEKETKIFKYQPDNLIEVENPISLEQRYLRPSLIPNLLKNVRNNLKQFDEIKIFELGKIFKKPKTEEKRMLTGLITGDAFYQAKGVIDLLFSELGISNIWYDEYKPTPEESKISVWHLKKSAEIKLNNTEIGFLGEISPRILDELKIEKKITVFDLDFEKSQKLCSEEHEYRPISRYPAAVRDLAVLVPREVKVEEVLNKIEIAGSLLVIDIDLFDIYEGEELPGGKKNLAFHLIYQAEDRTLSSKEIDEVQQKIIKSLEEEPEWQVRK